MLLSQGIACVSQCALGILIHRAPFEKAARHHGHAQREAGQHGRCFALTRRIPPTSRTSCSPIRSSSFAAFIAVLLVGLAKGGFSGIGMAATPLLALAVPPLQALAILLPILIVQDVVSLWWYRRDWDGWNLKVMLPGAVIGVGLAWARRLRRVGRCRAADHRGDRRHVRAQCLVRQAAAAGPAERGERRVLGRRRRPSPRPSRRPACRRSRSTCCRSGWRSCRLVGTVTMFFAAVNADAGRALLRARRTSTLDNLKISLALLPLAIATNFLGFWLVLRIADRPVLPHRLRADVPRSRPRSWRRALSDCCAAGVSSLPDEMARFSSPCCSACAPRRRSTCRAIAARAALRRRIRSRLSRRALAIGVTHARARPRDDQGRRAGRQPRPPAQPGSHTRAGRQIPRGARVRRSAR